MKTGATVTSHGPMNLSVNPATGKMYWVSYWGAGTGPGYFKVADYPSGSNAKIIEANVGAENHADYMAHDPVANRVWYFHRTSTGVTLKYANGDGTGVTGTGLTGFDSPLVIFNE